VPTPTPPPAQPQVQAPSTPNPPVPDSVIARQAALSSSHTNVKPAGMQNSTWQNSPPNLNNINPNNLPPGWTKTTHNGFTHVRDTSGTIRMQIHPPDRVTTFNHKHFYDNFGNPLDIHGRIVDPRSPNAHIPLH